MWFSFDDYNYSSAFLNASTDSNRVVLFCDQENLLGKHLISKCIIYISKIAEYPKIEDIFYFGTGSTIFVTKTSSKSVASVLKRRL
jgi:hypothetical protein